MTTAAPRSPAPIQTEEEARRVFEDTLRDMMRDWRRDGVVLETGNPLWRYWPADDNPTRADG